MHYTFYFPFMTFANVLILYLCDWLTFANQVTTTHPVPRRGPGNEYQSAQLIFHKGMTDTQKKNAGFILESGKTACCRCLLRPVSLLICKTSLRLTSTSIPGCLTNAPVLGAESKPQSLPNSLTWGQTNQQIHNQTFKNYHLLKP